MLIIDRRWEHKARRFTKNMLSEALFTLFNYRCFACCVVLCCVGRAIGIPLRSIFAWKSRLGHEKPYFLLVELISCAWHRELLNITAASQARWKEMIRSVVTVVVEVVFFSSSKFLVAGWCSSMCSKLVHVHVHRYSRYSRQAHHF